MRLKIIYNGIVPSLLKYIQFKLQLKNNLEIQLIQLNNTFEKRQEMLKLR